MLIEITKLKKLLIDPGHVEKKDFDAAVKRAKEIDGDVDDVLVDMGLIKDEQLGQIIAEEIGFPFTDLNKEKIEEDVFLLIPDIVAKEKGVIAYGKTKSGVKIGMRNPADLEIRHLLEKRVGDMVIPHYITNLQFIEALELYKGSIKSKFDKLLEKIKAKETKQEEKDRLVVNMVDTLLEYGHQNKASDIHIEPLNKRIIVRFRIDGVMHQVLELPKNLLEFILTRIKILAKLRTDEHRSAQDGKIRFNTENENVGARVSIVPVVEGENIVIRILSSKSRQHSLEDIGLSPKNIEIVKNSIKKPHGMILVTGPTGSGKTTTLYSVLKILNKPEVHISTIEDPVEYDIEGVSQIQVNSKTNLTFAKGLRAIVRQDPDIIMVGEIRDKETAGIAVNSAMTGHLVLSTLHTNDAATTLPRLIDMEVEPYLVATTVNIIIAQRLARMICTKCRVSYSIKKADQGLIEYQEHIKDLLEKIKGKSIDKISLFKGEGCKLCNQTGYRGRIGVFEIMEIDDDIRALVVKRSPSNNITNLARTKGMKTMLEDGLEKVLNGVTTIDEVLRVTKD